MIKRRGPPSQTWRTLLENQGQEIIALDFFTVPTATLRILFVLIILSHDRRRMQLRRRNQHTGTAVACPKKLLGWAVTYRRISGNIVFELPRIDAPFVNLNFLSDHRVGFDRGLTSSYSRAG